MNHPKKALSLLAAATGGMLRQRQAMYDLIAMKCGYLPRCSQCAPAPGPVRKPLHPIFRHCGDFIAAQTRVEQKPANIYGFAALMVPFAATHACDPYATLEIRSSRASLGFPEQLAQTSKNGTFGNAKAANGNPPDAIEPVRNITRNSTVPAYPLFTTCLGIFGIARDRLQSSLKHRWQAIDHKEPTQ